MTRHIVGIAAMLMLFSCAGGTSTAELKLMDAPPDGVTAVNVKVASMEVHVAEAKPDDDDDGGKPDDKGSHKDALKNGDDSDAPDDGSIDEDSSWQKLEVNKTIDLVAHQGEGAAEVLGQLDLPEGKITQIRLTLDTSAPENNTAVFNGATCNLDVSRVAKKGVKINHVFKAVPSAAGDKLEVLVDFDLERSLKPAGDCFALEPQLRLAKVKDNGKEHALE